MVDFLYRRPHVIDFVTHHYLGLTWKYKVVIFESLGYLLLARVSSLAKTPLIYSAGCQWSCDLTLPQMEAWSTEAAPSLDSLLWLVDRGEWHFPIVSTNKKEICVITTNTGLQFSLKQLVRTNWVLLSKWIFQRMSKTFAHSQIFMPVLKKLATVYLTKEKVFGKDIRNAPFPLSSGCRGVSVWVWLAEK